MKDLLQFSGVPRGGLGGVQTPPKVSEGPPKSCQIKPILKTVKKIDVFGTPTPPKMLGTKAVKF